MGQKVQTVAVDHLSDFKAKIAEVCLANQNYDGFFYSDFAVDSHIGALYVSWSNGGISGASCWRGKPYREPPEKPKDIDILDAVLESIAPTISFLAYKRLCKKIRVDSTTERDYYGNYHETAFKFLTIQDLYDFLQSENLL